MERIRVASLQYFIRPVQTFEQFRHQVTALVETAVDYKCHLLVFPEYFTVQLAHAGQRAATDSRADRRSARGRCRATSSFSASWRGSTRFTSSPGRSPCFDEAKNALYNDSHFFSPSGEYSVQGKMHMTRFESEEWDVAAAREAEEFSKPISGRSRSRFATT